MLPSTYNPSKDPEEDILKPPAIKRIVQGPPNRSILSPLPTNPDERIFEIGSPESIDFILKRLDELHRKPLETPEESREALNRFYSDILNELTPNRRRRKSKKNNTDNPPESP